MIPLVLGTDRETNQKVSIEPDILRTHLHLLGATGSGKTVSIQTLVRPLIMTPRPKCCLFLVDPMGNLSNDLLKWIANERLCPEHVRQRLIYIEPARENLVLPFNPLLHESDDHLYYQVGRTIEIMLRAWASQNIEEMPRLRQWSFNLCYAVASMGLPLAASEYLLHPGSPEHEALIGRLSPRLRIVWSEILHSRIADRVRILESTRNRLAPFFDSGILRRMFSTRESRFDVARFIRERRVVLINLKGYKRVDAHIAHTIGGMFVNEIIEQALDLTPAEVDPTYLLLDEFQHFVGPDLFDALPIVRQMGLRLILAHQSLCQLEKSEIDMTQLIWQARSRLLFANDGEDADRIAHELATITFNPKDLKEELKQQKQRIAGYHSEWTSNFSDSHSTSNSIDTSTQYGSGWDSGVTRDPEGNTETRKVSDSERTTRGRAEKHGETSGSSRGRSEVIVTDHEDFWEVSRRTYYTFDEKRVEWAQKVRNRRTGSAFAKFKDDPRLYDLAIDHQPIRETPELLRRVEELKAKNFESEFFRSKEDVEAEMEKLRAEILSTPKIVLSSGQLMPVAASADPVGNVIVPDCPLR